MDLSWWKDLGDVVKAWWYVIATVLAPVVWRYGMKPVVDFVRRLDASIVMVDRMSKALGTNGGSSLADKIHITAKVSVMNAARMAAFMDQIERPLFETDVDGSYTRINRAMEDLLGYSSDDMRGRGWITAVADEDRDRTVREWFHTIEDKRACVIRTRLLSRRGIVIDARIEAQPMDNDGDIVAWMGTVSVIHAQGAR